MTVKRTQVVMLPTNEKASKLCFIVGTEQAVLTLFEDEMSKSRRFFPQHLYFLSDEGIKEGDWCIDKYNQIGIVRYAKKGESDGLGQLPINKLFFFFAKNTAITDNLVGHECKKIIATTDSSLFKEVSSTGYTEDRARTFYGKEYLPQPSQDFIKVFVEEYNKGNVIEWVDVEYEYRHDDTVPYPKTLDGQSILKVNFKNEITIRKIKDSYSREEVIKLIEKHTEDMFKQRTTLDKWISENL